MADRLAIDHHPGQVVVVCGTNQKTKDALDSHQWPGEGSGVKVKILGFVSNMDEWMAASDLLVTKVWFSSRCSPAFTMRVALEPARGGHLVLSHF